jgi:hypothetical protein
MRTIRTQFSDRELVSDMCVIAARQQQDWGSGCDACDYHAAEWKASHCDYCRCHANQVDHKAIKMGGRREVGTEATIMNVRDACDPKP